MLLTRIQTRSAVQIQLKPLSLGLSSPFARIEKVRWPTVRLAQRERRKTVPYFLFLISAPTNQINEQSLFLANELLLHHLLLPLWLFAWLEFEFEFKFEIEIEIDVAQTPRRSLCSTPARLSAVIFLLCPSRSSRYRTFARVCTEETDLAAGSLYCGHSDA